jgi:N-acetylglucosamine kinase-like BadF-type ATPase
VNTDKQSGWLGSQVFVGVDGGGTKTQALIGCLVEGRLRIIGAGQGGASNPRAVGFEHAFASISQAVHSAFESAGIKQQTCWRAVLCLAGAGRDQERLAVESWALQSGLANEVRLVSEAEAVLAAIKLDAAEQASSVGGGTSDDGGTSVDGGTQPAEIALICGTGSLAWGRLVLSNKTARAGGWGYLLGDEGSGFWIGQHLLQLACQIADHRLQDDRVLVAVLDHLNLASANELVQWCYGRANSRERIAAIAPIAFELQTVESVAELIAAGARSLAKMIAAVTEQLGCSSYTLAVAGSVVLQQPNYLEQMLACLIDHNQAPPSSHARVAEPVRGALQLATL